MRTAIWREILIILALAVTCYLGFRFSLHNSGVIGSSMEPSLHDGARVLVSKFAYRFGGSPERGDIIVFEPPPQAASSLDYVKRVIGLPGESVETRNGRVYIHKSNGDVVALDESAYLSTATIGSYISGVIPEGQYFVMGDNRNESGDSRQGWTVPRPDILGRAWFVIWPPSQWGAAPNQRLSAGF